MANEVRLFHSNVLTNNIVGLSAAFTNPDNLTTFNKRLVASQLSTGTALINGINYPRAYKWKFTSLTGKPIYGFMIGPNSLNPQGSIAIKVTADTDINYMGGAYPSVYQICQPNSFRTALPLGYLPQARIEGTTELKHPGISFIFDNPVYTTELTVEIGASAYDSAYMYTSYMSVFGNENDTHELGSLLTVNSVKPSSTYSFKNTSSNLTVGSVTYQKDASDNKLNYDLEFSLVSRQFIAKLTDLLYKGKPVFVQAKIASTNNVVDRLQSSVAYNIEHNFSRMCRIGSNISITNVHDNYHDVKVSFESL